jgi:iron(II)-dependent oxidoreductase
MSEEDDLVSLVESPQATLDERIAAAHALATLGDPRITGTNTPRIAIPGASSAIDRYPVTVLAFSAFIAAGAYRERRWWTDEGWAWRVPATWPRLWGEAEWALYLVANHPVVGFAISKRRLTPFVDARLPTSRMGEGGVQSNPQVPWGDEWQDDACGMRGSARVTVPVGVFPKEKPGVSDVVGCVWQWCSDAFVGWGGEGAGASDGEASSPRRTACGGAWNTLAWSLTCQSRNGFPKTARFSNLGFRCVA